MSATSLEDEIVKACDNVEKTLAEAGASCRDVVNIHSYHVPTAADSIGDQHMAVMVDQFHKRFGESLPLRTALGVKALALPDQHVEIRSSPSSDPAQVGRPLVRPTRRRRAAADWRRRRPTTPNITATPDPRIDAPSPHVDSCGCGAFCALTGANARGSLGNEMGGPARWLSQPSASTRSRQARSQRRHTSAHTRQCSCFAACLSHSSALVLQAVAHVWSTVLVKLAS